MNKRKQIRKDINAYMNMISMFLTEGSRFSYLNALGNIVNGFEGAFEQSLKNIYNHIRATGNINSIDMLSDEYADFKTLRMFNDHIKVYEKSGGNEKSFSDLTKLNNFELAQTDKLITSKNLALLNTYQLLLFTLGGILFFKYTLNTYYEYFIRSTIGLIVTTATLVAVMVIVFYAEKIYADDKILDM